jgi:uncharacterized membrane protein YebE (DUF533 family)
MSQEGRNNTILGIGALVKALGDIRETVQQARADGHIDRQEALNIFAELAGACIREGLAVALSAAAHKADISQMVE